MGREYPTETLLSRLSGITAVLDGHSHKIYNVTSKDKDNNHIFITQTVTKITRIGELILKNDGGVISRIIDKIPEPEDTTNALNITRSKTNVWVHKETSQFLDSIWAKYERELKIVYGYSKFDFLLKEKSAEDTTTPFCRENECTLGNLITDAIRIKTESDICLINNII